jgi:hypothetical protein
MSIEALVLALGSALRPAGLAAVYALLARDHPRQLLFAYLVVGYIFSAGFGILAVGLFQTADLHPPTVLSGIFDLVVGSAALGFAAGVYSGRTLSRSPDDMAGSESWALRKLREPSAPIAAVVGIATHLPGLFYLLALNAIIAERQSLAADIAHVLIYNAIWYGVSVAAVFFLVIRPSAAKEAFARLNTWVRARERPILIAVFTVVGVYLVAHGIDLLVR